MVSANGNAGGSGKAAHITNNTTTKPNVYTKGKQGAAELLSPEVNPLQYQSVDSLRFKYSVRGSADDHGYVLYDIGDGNLYFWGAQGFTGCGPYYGTSSTRTQSLSLPVPAGIKNKKFNIAFYWETDTAKNGNDPGLNIDDVSLTAQPYKIETGVSTSFGFDVQPGSVNKFRSSNNNIVADVKAASAKIAGMSAGVTEGGNDKALRNIEQRSGKPHKKSDHFKICSHRFFNELYCYILFHHRRNVGMGCKGWQPAYSESKERVEFIRQSHLRRCRDALCQHR